MFINSNSEKFITLSQQVKEIVKDGLKLVPEFIKGIDKVLYLKSFVEGLDNSKRDVLRNFLESLLYSMHLVEASDLDFGGPGSMNKFWMRIHGNKRPVPNLPEFNSTETSILILNILSEKQIEYLISKRNLDFSIEIKETHPYLRMYRYRADAYFELDELSLNCRAILSQIRPFAELGFHPYVAQLMSLNYMKEGLILITGVTGAGKSTTLDAIIDENNSSCDAHIVIISSPVEYVHQSKRCMVRHREVGRDVLSFKDGTIQALRQDPDIIVIGELRDPETIVAALDVTDSGHKVFSTLHTSSAVETIDRIIGETDVQEQERVRMRLADVLRCIVSQKLVPTVDGKRTLAKEVLVVTPSVRAAIKNNNTGEIYQMIHQGSDYGMNTMEQDLTRLFKARRITYETAIAFANNKSRIQQLITSKI